MPGVSGPQQQAGILSFYDAPERGPSLNPRIILIAVAVFAIAVLILNHFSGL